MSWNFVNYCVLVIQSCPTLCDPKDHSPPGSPVHGIYQTRILEWVAISFSRASSQPRHWTQVSCTVGRCFAVWAREVCVVNYCYNLKGRWAQTQVGTGWGGQTGKFQQRVRRPGPICLHCAFSGEGNTHTSFTCSSGWEKEGTRNLRKRERKGRVNRQKVCSILNKWIHTTLCNHLLIAQLESHEM